MKEFLEKIIKQLVDKPEVVRVNEIVGEHMTVYELHVAKDDLGKVIGKKGQTAKSIRMILAAASKRIGRNAILEIIE